MRSVCLDKGKCPYSLWWGVLVLVLWQHLLVSASTRYNDASPETEEQNLFHPANSPEETNSWSRPPRRVSSRLTQRLLAVRVSTATEQPAESVALIQGAVFGIGGVPNPANITDAMSVVAQYAAVSHEQLWFVPATADGVRGGVLDLTVANISFTAGTRVRNVTASILEQAARAVGVTSLLEVADHVLFCLPTGGWYNGNSSNWTAYTYLSEPYSYYQKSRCTRLSVVMHEIGHSLGFQHSGVGNSVYGDKTCYMGFALNQLGYPRKAFNAYKHWISGWFRDRSVVIDPWKGPVEKRLVSFVHYSDDEAMTSDDVVLIRIGNLYLQYNRAKLYNIDADLPNTVTITYSPSDEDVSDRLAALADGELFEYMNFDDAGASLFVQVCSMVQFESTSQIDFAIVRMYVDDGVHDWSTCNPEYIPQPQAPVGVDTTNSTVSNNVTNARNQSTTGGQFFVDMDDGEGGNETTTVSNNQTSNNDGVPKENIAKGTVVLAVATIGSFLVTFIGSYCIFVKYCPRKRKGTDGSPQHPTTIDSKKTEEDLDPTSSLDADLFWSSDTGLVEI